MTPANLTGFDMSKFNMNIRQRGFGLLEVLIAILVLSVGMLSLGSLHSMIIKSSSASKARSTAAMLAQEKLDDMVSYQQLTSGGNGTFGFAEIASNTGGAENADGTLKIPNGTTSVGNTTYNRSWAVQDYYFCSENSAPSTSNTCLAPNPNFKMITMSVTWDEPGTGPGCTNGSCSRAVSLQSVVAAISPASTGQSAVTGGRGAPTVNYTPGTAPDVIPIGLGDNTKKEATKPTPDITQHGTSTITSFDEITYNTVLNTKRRDNFFTVNCVCQQSGVPASATNEGYLPTTFDGTEYVIPPITTSSGVSKRTTTKRVGSTYRQGQLGEQPALCDICCRDHHDATKPSTSTPSSFDTVYDPFRPLSDYDSTTGDHNHYYVDNSGTLVLANNTDDRYFEACKMALVGGSPWVLQDWKLEAHQIMPASYLSSNVSTYANYVTTFITQFLSDDGTSSTSTAYPITTPTASHGVTNPNINATVVSALSPLPTTDTMNVGGTSQYVGRGIYIDYMSPALRKTIRCKINPSLESGCTNTTAENYLHLVPFHEVNLTRLAAWSPTQDTIAQVTSTAITNGNEATFGRGLVTAIGAGTKNITSTIAMSNTGLTGGSNALDFFDVSPTYAIADSVAITVSGTTPPPASTITVSGTISNSSGVNGLASGVAILGSGSASCTLTGNNFPLTYSCTFTSGSSGTISIRGYSKGSETTNSSSNSNNCLNAPSTSGLTLPPAISFTAGDSFTTTTDSNNAETSTFSFTGTANITLDFTVKVDANSNNGDCP